MPASWSQALYDIAEQLYPQMVALRRHLHAHPEPSGEEHQTSLHLYRLFTEEGFQVRIGSEGRGVMVDPPEPSQQPCIALRADIDALRIQDAKAVPYCSQTPGVMHACGHDAHTGAVYGALMTLRRAADSGALPWPVNWRGIFQPAEETSRGAHEMVAAGALEGVSAILGLHVDPSRSCGKIGVRNGEFTASCDELVVSIAGRGGHAARPHESIDPIAAAAQLISSIYLFVPRAVDTHDPVVVTIGEIHGGDNSNVIPEQVQLRGTLRTLNKATQERTKNHIRQLARGIAEASGAQVHVSFKAGPESVYNDPELTALVRHAACEALGPGNVEEIRRPSMGGEDFAHYLNHVPGSMFRVGCTSETAGGASLHSPLFDIDERAMVVGAKILAQTVVLWSNPSVKTTT